MPNVGPLELAIVLIIALVVFGPKRLPELGKSLGRGIREFKGSVTGEHDDDEPEPPAEIESPQPPPPPKESGEPEKKAEDEPVVHDRG
jgi:sec-independent protein translocase protein TatA